MAPKRKIAHGVASTTKKAKMDASRDVIRYKTRESTRSPSASAESLDDDPHQNKETSPGWELVGEDSRDALKVGVVTPERLVLKFRNKKSREKTCYTYTRTADDIDWNDKKDIDGINKWRRQLFSRKDFTSRHRKTTWAPAEEAFVELMVGELASSKEQLLPHPRKLLDAFNDFFEGRSDLTNANGKLLPTRESRKLDTFRNYLRRQESPRATLHKMIKERMLDNSDEARVPTITDAMIEACMKKDEGRTKVRSLTAPVKRTGRKEKSPAPGNVVKRQPAAGSAKKTVQQSLAKDRSDNYETSRMRAGQDLAHAPSGCDVSAPLPQPARSPGTLLTHRRCSKPIASSRSIRATPLLTLDPKTGEKLQWTYQKERPVVDTDPEVMARLVKEGFVFTDIPANDEEAIRLHRESGNRRERDHSHIMQAIEGLDDRMKRKPAYHHSGQEREAWSRDFVKDGMWKEEDWNQKSARRPGAAAVNSIVNAAIVRPLGYGGDFHDLIKKRVLSNGAILLAEANAESIAKITRRHEQTYSPPRGPKQTQRSVYEDDSSVTGDEPEAEADES